MRDLAMTAPVDTVAAIKAEIVHSAHVACDGGNHRMGHPKVYLAFADASPVVCPYCSRKFVMADGVKVGGH